MLGTGGEVCTPGTPKSRLRGHPCIDLPTFSPQSKADPAGAGGEDSWSLDPTTPTAEIRDALSLSLLILFYFGHSVGLAGFWFPNQGLNLCPLP